MLICILSKDSAHLYREAALNVLVRPTHTIHMFTAIILYAYNEEHLK
jgi:hypothetical protein